VPSRQAVQGRLSGLQNLWFSELHALHFPQSYSSATPFCWRQHIPKNSSVRYSVSLRVPRANGDLVDPDTSIEFPKEIRVASKTPLPTYVLLGCGCRTVSFLGIKVYSVGFYADMSNPRLKDIPEDATPEERIKFNVNNCSCLLRIGTHLNLPHS